MKHLFLSLTTFALLIYCSCSDNGTNPKDEPDTTSHNFSWQIFEFPTQQIQGGNYFWDIFAESDSNVWAVGQIYTDSLDSSGNYVKPYNAAHWNGHKWNLKRFWLKYQTSNPAFVDQLNAIWYFSENSIYLVRGSIYYYSGNLAQLSYDSWQYGSVYHIWAASENNIYAVGTGGLIIHYNGTSWSKMESGTTMDFQDIWGTVDKESGNVEVWTVGYDLTTERHGIILKYDGSSWKTVFDKNNNIYDPDWDHTVPTSVWGYKDSVYVSLSGVDDSNIMQHLRSNFSTNFRKIHTEAQGAIQSIDGNGYNDFFMVGQSDVVLHYNGSTVKSYFPWKYLDGFYNGVQQIEDEVFICGYIFTSNSAVLLHGKR